ncbi:hypothetical protein DF157_01180 [Burkholderia cenocepacia]|nr:hypothetical protein DF157_01180 [Burkholderia cenocepacia]RQU31339.1 hypothetical protein DF142_33945 [Burkholderia cenocepacia]RQU61733.1 hypothetical protein DF140_25385 [Burkholderia cenocepacia]RQU87806.1 hypothetical protein DF040_24535 [Burkholderia cenocepacia]
MGLLINMKKHEPGEPGSATVKGSVARNGHRQVASIRRPSAARAPRARPSNTRRPPARLRR